MDLRRIGVVGRLLAATMLTGVALLASGCGDSNGDDGGGDATGAQATSDQREQGSDEGAAETLDDDAQIKAVYAKLTDAFYADDATAFCDLLTKSAQRELASVAPKPMSCVEFVTDLVAEDKQGRKGDARPSIVKLTVKGDRAVALTKTPRSLRYRVTFVKQDGTWKINGGIGG
jgi:hypothetical protein